MSLMSAKMWNREWDAAQQARRDAEQWDKENMVVASPSSTLFPPDLQRLPLELFEGFSIPEGWLVNFNGTAGRKEFYDPRGRIWIVDFDNQCLVLRDRPDPTPAVEPEEPSKPVDRFAGLEI